MENKDLISVVVPVYNAEKYLEACLDSILTQTYENIEVILVDDGSTDGSLAICDRYSDKDSRVKVFHYENAGAAQARNRGADNSSGQYLAYVDSDDTISEDYIENLYELIIEHDADIAVCGYKTIYESESLDTVEEPLLIGEDKVCTGVQAMEKLLYQKGLMSVPWGNLAKRDIWNKVSFPTGTRAEDVGTMYKFYLAADRVIISEKPMYNYYLRSNNTIFNVTTQYAKNTDYYKHSREIIRYVIEKYPESKKSAYARHFSTCFQILSETPKKSKYNALLNHVYADIRILQNKILHDKNARMINRVAALLSLVDIRILHIALRGYYKVKTLKVKLGR